jgi:type II secretory pathway pseudopilin PulG
MPDQFCKSCGADMPGASDNCPQCGATVKKGIPLIIMVAIIAGVGAVGLFIIGIFAAIMIPNYLMTKARSQLTQCQGNMKLIGTALDAYRYDNQDRYPQNLKMLCPKYLSAIPTCAAAEKDTYSNLYTTNENGSIYTFFCAGSYHRIARLAENCPQYSSIGGLTSKPLVYPSSRTRRRGST